MAGVGAQSLHALPGVPGQHRLDIRADAHHLVGLQDQVRDGSPALSGGLVEDDPRVWQCRALALGAGGEEDSADGDSFPHHRGGDLGSDVPHGVVDREHRARVAALAVDVQLDVTVGVVRLEVQQLGDEGVRNPGVDSCSEVDNPLRQQVRVDIRHPITARMLREDTGDRVAAHRSLPSAATLNPVATRSRGLRSSNDSTMASTNPYSRASSAVYQWSCRESSKTRSTGCPVSSAIRRSTVSRVWRRSSACSSMSIALPPIPAEPWCMSTRELGRALRLPFVPAESKNCPALYAMPKTSVETSLGIVRITSRMANMAGTDPPGEWIHREMPADGSSVASAISWVASSVPLSSSRGPSSTSTRRS